MKHWANPRRHITQADLDVIERGFGDRPARHLSAEDFDPPAPSWRKIGGMFLLFLVSCSIWWL